MLPAVNWTRYRVWLAASGLLGGLIAASVLYAEQPQQAEYQVKAAFLYNFAKFVEWPPRAFPTPSAPFSICLMSDPFDGALDKITQGEVLDGHPLVIRRIRSAEDVSSCQMVYLAASDGTRAPEIVKQADAHPVLTVGESDNFISSGGIIRFVQIGGRIRFQINPDAAARASLRLSSKLLRLAEIVRSSAGELQ